MMLCFIIEMCEIWYMDTKFITLVIKITQQRQQYKPFCILQFDFHKTKNDM